MFIPELLDPNDPIDAASIRSRNELDECIATGGECANTKHKDNIAQSSKSIYCDICHKNIATKTYDVNMFFIENKEYAPPVGKMFRYRKQKVKVPCCHSCLASIERGNTIVSIIVLLAALVTYVCLFSHAVSGILQHIVAFLFTICITGFFGFPIFWVISRLCGESKLYHKSETIRRMESQGWKVGSKPSKCDM